MNANLWPLALAAATPTITRDAQEQLWVGVFTISMDPEWKQDISKSGSASSSEGITASTVYNLVGDGRARVRCQVERSVGTSQSSQRFVGNGPLASALSEKLAAKDANKERSRVDIEAVEVRRDQRGKDLLIYVRSQWGKNQPGVMVRQSVNVNFTRQGKFYGLTKTCWNLEPWKRSIAFAALDDLSKGLIVKFFPD